MATIDNLQLSIEATDRASSKIESLAHALSSLKGSVPNNASLNSVAKGIKSIADSANAIDGRTMTSIAGKVTKLATALSAFQSVPKGLKSAGDGIKSITDALRQIDGRTINSVQSKLTKLGSGLSGFPKSVSNLTNVANGIIDISTAVDTLSEESIQRIERLGNALQGFRGLNVRGVTRLAQSDTVATQPQKSTESLREGAIGNTNTQKLSFNLDNVRAKLSGVASKAFEVGYAITKAFATTAIKGFRFALEGLKRVFNTLTAPLRNLVRSLGRIAFYRVIRSLIKEIGQGLKEGIQNLAQFSKLMNELDTHSANRVMSLYASNLLYFKNAVATAVIPILKSLEPIFDSLINKGVELINVMAQLFSYLSGSSTYTRAKYFYVDYAESLDKASGSAGKLNKQLAQFDELNNLTTSSGSGRDNALDYLEMFEDPIPIEDWIKNLDNQNWGGFGKKIADKITETLSNIDWATIKEKAGGFGRGFAGFLNGFLDEDMFGSIGSTLAEGLNTAVNFAFGFGEEFDGGKFGKGIANGINAFFRDFDFGKLGLTLRTWATKLGDAIKSAVENVDWEQVYNKIGEFLEGLGIRDKVTFYRIPDEIENLKAEWQKLLDKFGVDNNSDLIKKILYLNVVETNREVNAFLTEFARIFKSAWETFPFVKELNLLMDKFINSVFIQTIKDAFVSAKDKIIDAIISAFPANSELMDKITNLFFSVAGHAKGGGSSDNTENYIKQFMSIGGDIASGIWAGIKAGAISLAQSSAKITYENIKNAIKKVFGIASPAKNMYDVGENIVLGIIEGFWLANIGGRLTQWFEEKVKPLFSESKWKELGNSAKNGLANIFSYSNFYNIGDTAGKALYNAFVTQLNSIVSAYNTIKSKIESNPIVQTIKTTTVGSVVGSGVTNSVEIIQELVDAYNKTPAATTVDGHKKGGTDTKTWHTENFPAKPAGMSSSAYASYIENWKKNNMKYPYYYASGGFPTMGSMFIAGEAGAELVGNINGRTGVANTLQIEDAMYQAVYDATSRALSENEMSVTIEGDMDKVFRVMQNKSRGFYTRTGRPAF